ncbi:proteasome subunit beta type-5-like [Oncorhynchus masou masou]|uniref:proteasome subunit beta type-5-like n=1 Tax=Oncorhynchus masou masou TaxID=90313 RepID=UPI003183140F
MLRIRVADVLLPTLTTKEQPVRKSRIQLQREVFSHRVLSLVMSFKSTTVFHTVNKQHYHIGVPLVQVGDDSVEHSSLSSLSTSPSPPTRRPFPLSHGTTTLAFVFQGGVIAAADTRASCSGLVSCPSVQKILPIHSHLLVTTSGSGADCMPLERILARECRVNELRNKECICVGATSKLLANMVYQYKGMGLSMATRVCGWDKRGPGLYYVDSEGNRVCGDLFAVGPGSMYAYGVVDSGLRQGMSVEEVWELGHRAIYQATYRDAYSGGQVNLNQEDVLKLHHQYQEQNI